MHSIRSIRLVLVLIGILFITSSCTKQKEQPPLVVEDVAAATDYTQIVSSAVSVQTKALRDKVVGSAAIQGQQEVSVKARTSGEIKSIHVALGSTLKKGDVLIELDDKVANLTLSQLEKQSENAQKELGVNEQLYAKGAISLSALNLSRSGADGLSAQLQNARNNLSNMSITTPIDGSVAEISKLVVGDLLQSGTQVARIVDLAHLRVVLAVGQSQLFLIKEGAKAEVVISTPTEDITAEGTVSAISASSDSRTGSWTVYVDFDNPRVDRIKAGITARVTIFNPDAPVYTLVPNAAIVNRNAKTYIFVAENATAQLVEVLIVDQFGDQTAVQSVDDTYDLSDKKVLVSALSRLVDGSSISSQIL